MKKEVQVGIFAVGAIALFIVGMNYLQGSKILGSPFRLYAEYPDVEGLLSGNPIMYKGVKVGKVGGSVLDQNTDRPRVLLEFDTERRFPTNSEAIIYSDGLLGSKAVRIAVNDSLASSTFLKDGDFIKGRLEEDLFDIAGNLVENQGQAILIEVAKLANNLNTIVASMRRTLDDPQARNTVRLVLEDVRASTQNLNSITGRVDSLAMVFNAIATDAQTLVGTVKSKNEDIEGIIGNIRTTTDSLQAASGEIKKLMTDASSAVGSVENLVTKLDTTTGTVGLLLNERGLYDSIANTTENINALIREVKENPQRFIDDIKIYLIERKPKPVKPYDVSNNPRGN